MRLPDTLTQKYLMKLTIYTIIVLLLSSCGVSKNVTETKNEIVAQTANSLQLQQKVDSLNDKRLAKIVAGELDSATDSIIKVYIFQLKDSVNNRLKYFNALVSNKKIRKNKKAVLAYLNQSKNLYKKELENVYFLDDLFNATTFNRLNTAAFFGSGEYKLSDTAYQKVSLVVKNILQQAFDFSAAHANKKLNAMFIVTGYADEEVISNGGNLYNELIVSITADHPNSKQLNTELSQRRASSIKNIFKINYDSVLIQKTVPALTSTFFAIGKGEILPSGNITNYLPIDERRRVVLIYWSILPELN